MVGVFKKLGKHRSYAYLVLRVFLGVIFIAHGYGKLWGGAPGWEAWTGMVTTLGFPFPTLTAYFVGFAELVGGIAIIIGLLTRPVALVLGVIMIVAILTAKLSKGLIGGYELDLGLLAGFITLLFTGAGKISLDRRWFRKTISRPADAMGTVTPAVSVDVSADSMESIAGNISEKPAPSPNE